MGKTIYLGGGELKNKGFGYFREDFSWEKFEKDKIKYRRVTYEDLNKCFDTDNLKIF